MENGRAEDSDAELEFHSKNTDMSSLDTRNRPICTVTDADLMGPHTIQ
jgi:hypothetical protein